MSVELEDIEIKSVVVQVSTSPVNLGLGAVPSGMKRFITFVKYNNEHTAANAVYLCSGTTATDATSGNARDKQYLGNQYDSIAYPDSPDIRSPLFSIAGGKFLSAYCNNGPMGVFIQYYDR